MIHLTTRTAGLVLLGTALAACASNNNRRAGDGRDSGAVPQAVAAEIADARTSVAEAQQAGAAEYGSAELGLARDKLNVAESEAREGNVARARQLAREAELDAELAAAMTRNRQTQLLADEVDAGLRTLEQELRRDTGAQRTSPSVPSAGGLR